MNPFVKSMDAAASGMRAQGFRLRVISENVANTDTPGYQRKQITFDNAFNADKGVNLVSVKDVSLDKSALTTIHDPSHPLADENGNVQLSNVNLMIEMADGREASRSYEANLSMFQQARQMYSSLLDIIRR